MIITRKIQIYVYEPESELRYNFINTIYEWRSLIRKAANIIIAHKFCQDNIKDFIYIKYDIKDKFRIKDILKDGKGMSEQNITYRVISEILKGKVPSDIYACLNQSVCNTYKETKLDVTKGIAGIRSYKNNIPIPFSAKSIANIHLNEEDNKYYFTLFGIPFRCVLGRDRSNNKVILDRCISKEYKLCSSSIQIDDKSKKIFLLLCVDIPAKQVELKEDNILHAYLSMEHPIIAKFNDKTYNIGTAEEFLYARRQIQEGYRRLQIACKYNKGGKGRNRKLQALERYKNKEKNYIDTKLHTYSRMLIDLALKLKCKYIVLEKEEINTENTVGEGFILRNWSYSGLITKIEYKAKMNNITVTKK